MYKPLAGIEVLEERRATIIGANQALKVRALRDCVDRERKRRVAGELWLVTKVGAYMLQECEAFVELVQAVVLTPTLALDVCAREAFVDARGKARKPGERYLVTQADCETYIPDVRETIMGQVSRVSLAKQEYCVVENPIDAQSGVPAFGRSELRRGERAFFPLPGERVGAPRPVIGKSYRSPSA